MATGGAKQPTFCTARAQRTVRPLLPQKWDVPQTHHFRRSNVSDAHRKSAGLSESAGGSEGWGRGVATDPRGCRAPHESRVMAPYAAHVLQRALLLDAFPEPAPHRTAPHRTAPQNHADTAWHGLTPRDAQILSGGTHVLHTSTHAIDTRSSACPLPENAHADRSAKRGALMPSKNNTDRLMGRGRGPGGRDARSWARCMAGLAVIRRHVTRVRARPPRTAKPVCVPPACSGRQACGHPGQAAGTERRGVWRLATPQPPGLDTTFGMGNQFNRIIIGVLLRGPPSKCTIRLLPAA